MQKIVDKVLSVKKIEYTTLDGKPAVSNRCFFLLKDGSIGFIKTPLDVQVGDSVEISFRCSKEMFLSPYISSILPKSKV